MINKNSKLVIFGTGELAHIAYEYFTHDSEYEVIAFCLDADYIDKKNFLGLPIISYPELTTNFDPENIDVYIAIGATKMNSAREAVFERIKSQGFKLASYVSSKAFVWHNVDIGQNVFIFENNTLQPFTKVEDNCILWSGNHIGHRTIIRAHSFISSHCVVSGYCEIGNNSYLGVNCTINDKIKISPRTLLGSGTVITKNTQEDSIYVGNPAKVVPGKNSLDVIFS